MQPTHVIVHHSLTKDSGTVSWHAIRRYHVETRGWAAIGYHAGLERVTDAAGHTHLETLIGRPWNQAGAHAVGMNNTSLGLCIVGNFDDAPPDVEVWDAAVDLVRWVTTLLSIPISNVRGHCEYSEKTCPGTFWSMDQFRSALYPSTGVRA